ncbi:unnamed protein product [Cunninghamella blakesleeana]
MDHSNEIQQSMISYSQHHIKDDIEGKTITVDEWIAKELERIEEKKEPRYCRDYEALIEVIEDISRIPSPVMNFIHSNKDENDSASFTSPIQYVLSSPHLSTSAISLSSPSSMLIPLSLPSLSTSSLSPTSLSLSSSPSSPSSTYPSLYLLDHAFITLLEYCWDNHYSPHHPCPVHLLLDMEKMILYIFDYYNKDNKDNKDNNNNNSNKIHHSSNNNNHSNHLRQPNDYHHIQTQLNHIIQIQSEIMTDENNTHHHHYQQQHLNQHTVIHSPWFSSSKMIQQWATSLSSVNEELEWKTLFMMGINAYNAAKSRSTFYSSLGLPPPPPPLSCISLSPSSSFSNSNSIYTIDHLEMLMQQIIK